MFKFSIAFVALVSIVGCSHKQVLKGVKGYSEPDGKGIELIVQTIKRKSSKADLVVAIRNTYPFTVVIPENSFRFTVNGEQGLGGNNPRWILKAGDIVTTLLKFELSERPLQVSTLKLEHVYEGDAMIVKGAVTDSSTIGTAIAAGNRNVVTGIGISNTTAASEGYAKKSAIEGRQLPPAVVEIPGQ